MLNKYIYKYITTGESDNVYKTTNRTLAAVRINKDGRLTNNKNKAIDLS